jgi:ribosomal protein L29
MNYTRRKEMTIEEMNYRIVSLRMDMDNYREARQFGKVAELRLEIARIEGVIRMKNNLK